MSGQEAGKHGAGDFIRKSACAAANGRRRAKIVDPDPRHHDPNCSRRPSAPAGRGTASPAINAQADLGTLRFAPSQHAILDMNSLNGLQAISAIPADGGVRDIPQFLPGAAKRTQPAAEAGSPVGACRPARIGLPRGGPVSSDHRCGRIDSRARSSASPWLGGGAWRAVGTAVVHVRRIGHQLRGGDAPVGQSERWGDPGRLGVLRGGAALSAASSGGCSGSASASGAKIGGGKNSVTTSACVLLARAICVPSVNSSATISASDQQR